MSKPCLMHEGALRGPYLPKQVGDVLCLCTRVTECLPTRRASERVVFRRGTADASGSAWSARARAGPHATVCLSLEPNGRRAARLVTALVQAKRAMNACGWMEAVPQGLHQPRALLQGAVDLLSIYVVYKDYNAIYKSAKPTYKSCKSDYKSAKSAIWFTPFTKRMYPFSKWRKPNSGFS